MQLPIEIPHREMYWHIAAPFKYFIYPILAVSLGAFAYGAYRKFNFWRQGQPDPKRFGQYVARAGKVFWEIPFQTRVLKDRTGGLLHVLIFWSFALLTLTTAIVFLDVDFQIPIYNGSLYLVVSLMADLAGLALLIGLGIASFRRYVVKAERLDNKWDDAFVLILLFAATLTGFVLEGLRIANTPDHWAAWAPVGLVFSKVMGGMSEATVMRVYQGLWWFHALVAFTFIGSIPYTKFFHIITLPLNTFFSSLEPKGSLERPDIEAMMNDEAAMDNFNVGVSAAKDLTWKMRLDYDSCLRCGRCLEVCPSYINKHPLAPKTFINDMKEFAWSEFQKSVKNGKGKPAGEGEAAPEEPAAIVGNVIENDVIWECRTCRACMEVCPAHIEHVPQIMELRRGEVMMRGQCPPDAAVALKTLERGGNPFGPQEERSKWIKDMKIPVIGAGEECEMLIWIGCCTTYDQIKQKVAYNVITILHEAGISSGVMGDEEFCCGDPARVLGDENLFQATAKSQIEKISSRKFKYLVTQCPHCYNVFKNEYPQFGAKFKVLHHTELIHQLIKDGRLDLELPIERTIAYHDPCYLGRYNDIYDMPREILKSIKGVKLVELKNTRERSQCCGGGGGHYWMDIPNGERINVARVKEAVQGKADIVAVGCVYCLQMLNDSVKLLDLDEKMQVLDISELVIEAMGGLPKVVSKSVIEVMAA
ncbi:MAG TPA: (Fe-S)-binding protein [bacterium]|nr:(Fe-S)-binding protein [bacterium]